MNDFRTTRAKLIEHIGCALMILFMLAMAGFAWKLASWDCWLAGVSAKAETAPLAICRAALLTLVEEGTDKLL